MKIMGQVFEGAEVLTREQRMEELQKELQELQGGQSGGSLENLFQNPSKLKAMFAVNDSQAGNLKSLIAGGGTALSVKYLGKSIGDVPAALIGAGLSAFLAGKIFGGGK